jgi:hypothetical protein
VRGVRRVHARGSAALMRRRGSEAWAWVSESYMFVLTVEELTPNSGLYWYAGRGAAL